MLVRKQKDDENRLIDFLSSAPADWDPASEQVIATTKCRLKSFLCLRQHTGWTHYVFGLFVSLSGRPERFY